MASLPAGNLIEPLGNNRLTGKKLIALIFAVNIDLPIIIHQFDNIGLMGKHAVVVIFDFIGNHIQRVDLG